MSDYLLVMSKPTPGAEKEFNAWYTGQHLSDVLALEGFTAAQRFRFVPTRISTREPAPYMAIYEVADGQREAAEAALLAALRGHRHEDGTVTGRMPLSDALDPELTTWWFESITPRVAAAEGSPGMA